MARGNEVLDWQATALRAPAGESAVERTHRLKHEAEAKRVSDDIDKQLKADAARRKPAAAEYRMLLLGQAGAGKTTVLKQMRLLYDPQTHQRERVFWKSIIHLNLLASLRILLQTLGASPVLSPDGEQAFRDLQLAPIASLEHALRKKLGAVGDEESVNEATASWHPRTASSSSEGSSTRNDLLLLRAGWQEKLLSLARRSFSLSDSSAPVQRPSSPDSTQDAQQLLQDLESSVVRLWAEPQCRKLRKHGKLEAADAMTFFLDSYARISDRGYEPSDEDILHARVRTVGVTEDRFRVDRHLIYRIFDVGGSRSQRAAWASFFDDAQAIIFLAPISAFNQTLVEDPCVNRVHDSLLLFAQIAASELLSRAALILFLNKVDLLEDKLRQGVQLSSFFPEYDGDNDFEAVWRWFRAKFKAVVTSKRSVAPRRPVYVHTTIATSTKQIKAILMSVNDTILRDNLRATGLVG